MFVQTRFFQDAVNRAVNEFLDLSDKDAESWIEHLLEGYMSGPAVIHTDADMRATFMRNLNAISHLVRAVQKAQNESGCPLN